MYVVFAMIFELKGTPVFYSFGYKRVRNIVMSRGYLAFLNWLKTPIYHLVSRGSYQYQQRFSTSPDCCHLDILLTIKFLMIY